MRRGLLHARTARAQTHDVSESGTRQSKSKRYCSSANQHGASYPVMSRGRRPLTQASDPCWALLQTTTVLVADGLGVSQTLLPCLRLYWH